MKLSDYAKRLGISYRAAWGWSEKEQKKRKTEKILKELKEEENEKEI